MHIKLWRGICVLALLTIFLGSETVKAANILALFPLASRSHNNVYSTITRALVQRGHRLTVVTSQPIDSPPPNYNQIDVNHLVDHLLHFNETKAMGPLTLIKKLKGMAVDICSVMRDERVNQLAKAEGGKKFDLILLSNFFSECYYPFGAVYKAPIVLISPAGPMPGTYQAIGNVVLPSYFAEPLVGYSDRMDLKERVVNTLMRAVFSAFYEYYIQGVMEEEMRAVFGKDTPPISQLQEHVSLALVNSHFSLNQARPTVPSLVEVGGLHLKPPKELPQDLKKYLDGAGKEGVIYFSLGSVLKSSEMSSEARDAFVSAFSRLKQRVLWKWEGATPIPGQTDNVRTEKWLPQLDVLAHPNVRMFITHGGLLSFQEASSRGVPLIGIPHFADQAMNMKRVVDLELGMRLDTNNLTADNILRAINGILSSPKYSTNMKRLSSIVKDQKDDPLERAIYWIEYVMRHDGAKHLKPAAFYLAWYQIYMLDVLFIIVVLPTLALIVLAIIVRKLFRKMCKAKGKDATSKKKTQ